MAAFASPRVTRRPAHWAVLTGRPGTLLRDSEWRFFTATLVVLSLVVAAILWSSGGTSVASALHVAGMDLSSLSTSIGMLGSNGAGLQDVGPFDDYASMPAAGKLLLTFLMVIGRLELYTVLILFTPSFWR